MKRILFVCHGNICRSPMAEFVMKDLAKKAGLASKFHIESAATSREEIGNPVYPPARRKLAEHGISCTNHAARQLTKEDYDQYDSLIAMDQTNLRNMNRICGGDYADKMSLLMDHTAHPGNVADPWYTVCFYGIAAAAGLRHTNGNIANTIGNIRCWDFLSTLTTISKKFFGQFSENCFEGRKKNGLHCKPFKKHTQVSYSK